MTLNYLITYLFFIVLTGVLIGAFVGFRSNIKFVLYALVGKISNFYKNFSQTSNKSRSIEAKELIKLNKTNVIKGDNFINECYENENSNEKLNKITGSSSINGPIEENKILKFEDLDQICSRISKINKL
jgi:hypothetical protein